MEFMVRSHGGWILRVKIPVSQSNTDIDDNLDGLSGGAGDDSPTLKSKAALLQQLHPNIRDKLTGQVWDLINYDPLSFIVAHTEFNQIISATVKKKKKFILDAQGGSTDNYELIPYVVLQKIMIAAIPIEVISHPSPLGFTDHRYTIKFSSSHSCGQFSIGPKTLEEIIIELREKALVYETRGAIEALSTIVGSFAKDKKIIINEDIEAPGFYWIHSKLKAYHVDHPKPSKKKIEECCDFIDTLVTKYRCREIVPTAIKWAIISPFDYALKQYTNDSAFLPWLHAYGWTRTGKTTIGSTIINGIWGKSADRKYKIPFSSVDSEAKLGFVLSQSTYPITINEVGALSDEKHKKMLEMVKNSIETRIARSKHIHKTTYTDVPALCACVLTSNSQPPNDPGYISKAIPIVFTKQDRPTLEDKNLFDDLISAKRHLLRVLGDFAINYIMKHPELLFKKKMEECNWKKTAEELIIKFYNAAGMPTPYWIEYFIEDKHVEESIDDSRVLLRLFFINAINNTYNRFARNINNNTEIKSTLHSRFKFCCDNQLIPSIVTIDDGKTVVIFSSIMKELHHVTSGIDKSEIASLQELANTIGLDYGQKWLNGKNTRVASGEVGKLISFFNSEIKDVGPQNQL
jgi:hypothetical protein